jgi:hypothetical protein
MLASLKTSATPANPYSTPVTSNGSKARRAPNWGPEEDKQLARSWNLVAKDPNESNYEFWIQVLSHFHQHSVGPQQDDSGLATRYVIMTCFFYVFIYL